MIRAWLAALTAALIATAAAAQGSYPDKPVRFIVGFTAGSATDITARLFAQKFQEAWNVPVTVENVPGAGGSVGGDRVAKSAPDGTTFYWGANGALTINPTLLTSQTYDVQRDLQPVVRLLVMPSILAVNNDVPATSFAEFVALAKAQPGKLNYASAGAGSGIHLGTVLFAEAAGIEITHVAYKGSGPALTDLLGGHVQMYFSSLPPAIGLVKEGKLRALGVTGLKRSASFPDVPTVAEQGLPGFEAVLHYGIVAPAGTPRPIVDKLNVALRAALGDPKVHGHIATEGAEPLPTSPEEYAADIDREETKWSALVRKSGAQAK